MTHENSPQAYHVHKEHESVEAIREALGSGDRLVPGTISEQEAQAFGALDSLLAYIKQLEALQEGYYVDAQQARARVEQLEGERDEAFKWIDVNRTRAEAAEQENERLREALEAVGDYAFGVWDDDGARRMAGSKAEGLARAALADRTEEQA